MPFSYGSTCHIDMVRDLVPRGPLAPSLPQSAQAVSTQHEASGVHRCPGYGSKRAAGRRVNLKNTGEMQVSGGGLSTIPVRHLSSTTLGIGRMGGPVMGDPCETTHRPGFNQLSPGYLKLPILRAA
jgi:hypothetical protein